jgi:NAD-dependent dihydropyrimidine dehydrogenase PreA subunit
VIESIDMALCNGCGMCVSSCMSDVIRMDEDTEEPVIKYPDDCASCLVCQMDCPQKAIHISSKIRVIQTTSWGL